MREIKFRAWDKKYGMSAPFNPLQFNYQIHFDNWRNSDEVHYFNSPISNKFVYMQYTGLKDKNGVEIYEGDIVKDESGDFWIIEFGKLPLNKAGDCVCTYQAFYAKALHEHRQMYDCIQPAEWQEVIGNIHENKELLDV